MAVLVLPLELILGSVAVGAVILCAVVRAFRGRDGNTTSRQSTASSLCALARGAMGCHPFDTTQGEPHASTHAARGSRGATGPAALDGPQGAAVAHHQSGDDSDAAGKLRDGDGAGAARGDAEEGPHAAFRMPRLPTEVQKARAKEFRSFMDGRRSVRFFSSEPIPDGVLEDCIATAGTAPSGAHTQPWTFVVVRSAAAKARIREAVEREEKVNYDRRMRSSWVKDVTALVSQLHGTAGPQKPYLTDAPAVIVVMSKSYDIGDAGERVPVYYPKESTGIAAGLLVAALHNANLVTLTSTPMGAERDIRRICSRPDNEKVFVLMPVGFPSSEATVPWRPKEARSDVPHTHRWRKSMSELFVEV